eukprot:4767845-Prymnesium_polylepis.1
MYRATDGARSASVCTAYAMPSLYAALVAVLPHLGLSLFVTRFGSESGSITTATGSLPSYSASTAAN